MLNTMLNLIKNILRKFPKTKVFLGNMYRKYRSTYLRIRYPKGAYKTCNGAKVFCDFSNENYSWYDGDSEYLDYELEVFTSLFEEKVPDVVLDIGAHWGFYPAFLDKSIYAKEIKKIIAIEADPFNQHLLSKTLENIDHIPVVQINAAISDKDGYIDMYSGGGMCSQTYCSSGAIHAGRAPALTLDSLSDTYLQKGEIITHVKLDIDGFEPAFFGGSVSILRKFKPVIMMEFWAKGLKASGIDLDAYWDMLQKNYHISEACFSSRQLVPMERGDLSYLINKTMEGITNLVLLPRA